jgi:hypothetical protein
MKHLVKRKRFGLCNLLILAIIILFVLVSCFDTNYAIRNHFSGEFKDKMLAYWTIAINKDVNFMGEFH